VGQAVGHLQPALVVQGKAQGPAHQPLGRAQHRAAGLQLPRRLGLQQLGRGQGELREPPCPLADDGRQPAQAAVQVGRGGDVAHARGGQAVGSAEVAGELLAGRAQLRRAGRGAQLALARRGLHLRVQDEHLADDDVGRGQGGVQGFVAGGGLGQEKIPDLQPGAALAQALGQLGQHGAGPGPGAQLGQAGFVDVHQHHARGRGGGRQRAGDLVVQPGVQQARRGTGSHPGHQQQHRQKQQQGVRPAWPHVQRAYFRPQSVTPRKVPALTSLEKR
jgi:hypothetical protein